MSEYFTSINRQTSSFVEFTRFLCYNLCNIPKARNEHITTITTRELKDRLSELQGQ